MALYDEFRINEKAFRRMAAYVCSKWSSEELRDLLRRHSEALGAYTSALREENSRLREAIELFNIKLNKDLREGRLHSLEEAFDEQPETLDS